MSKPKAIQINIPNPCSQNWDEMTPHGNDDSMTTTVLNQVNTLIKKIL